MQLLNIIMFRQLLSVGCVPDEWKNAVITPVHKKGSTSSLTNYRPISITCVPCKLLERIVVSRIYNHLVFNDVLHCEQHGFVRGLSTYTSLNDWTRNTQLSYILILLKPSMWYSMTNCFPNFVPVV